MSGESAQNQALVAGRVGASHEHAHDHDQNAGHERNGGNLIGPDGFESSHWCYGRGAFVLADNLLGLHSR